MSSLFDYLACFSDSAVAPATSATALTLTGHVLNRYANGKLFVRLLAGSAGATDPAVVRVLDSRPDGLLPIWSAPGDEVPLHAEVLLHGVFERSVSSDCLNCTSVEVLSTNLDAVLPCEHMPLPIPDNDKGKPFLLRFPGENGVLLWKQAPGTRLEAQYDCTKLSWVRKHANGGVEQRCLSITGKLTQWTTTEELGCGAAPSKSFKMMLWDDKCAALGLTSDMDVWKRLMTVHVIPFTAAVYTDTASSPRYQTDTTHITLGVLNIHWELLDYLQRRGKSVSLTPSQAADLLPLTIPANAPALDGAAPADGLVNVTTLNELPIAKAGTEWRYYALCSNRAIRDAAQLRKALSRRSEVAVIWAVPLKLDAEADAVVLVDLEEDAAEIGESPHKKAKASKKEKALKKRPQDF